MSRDEVVGLLLILCLCISAVLTWLIFAAYKWLFCQEPLTKPSFIHKETLEKFLDNNVRPNSEFLNTCHQVIDTVVRLIHRHPKYSVDQVIKGGSLGKGTAVRGHSDVDLLVVLNDFNTVQDLKNNMTSVLGDFQEYLSSNATVDIRNSSTTPFTLRFELRCSPDFSWIDVDLLPIVDVWSSWTMGRARGLQLTYDIMEGNSSLRKYYAKSLAKVQVEFVKYLPARVKDLIRLLKYWKYSEEINLSSYCIELLVIHVWRNNGSPNNFAMKTLMSEVVRELANFGNCTISFGDHYEPSRYISKLNKSPPYVLDPANPFHDVSADVQWNFATFSSDYSHIESKARVLKQKLDGSSDGNLGYIFS